LPQKCPKCDAPFLVKKINKAGEVFHVCLEKACDYKEKATTEASSALTEA